MCSAFRVGGARVPPADVPRSGGQGGQAGKAGNYGKAAAGVCRQASWSPGGWPPHEGGPGVWTLGAGSHWGGGGELCNYGSRATENVTLLRSTASFLGRRGREDLAALPLGAAVALAVSIWVTWRDVKTDRF